MTIKDCHKRGDILEKYRTAVTIPVKVADLLKDVSNKTGKSVNSLIVDSCIDYLKKFNQEYSFLFKEEKSDE